METKETIINKIRKNLPFLKSQYHIKEMSVFGSYVRNEQNAQSDIDILVEFDTSIGFFDFIKAENYLTELLGRKVDLVMKDVLKPRIGEVILREMVLI